MTTMMKTFAAGASAIALGGFAVTASAQDATTENDVQVEQDARIDAQIESTADVVSDTKARQDAQIKDTARVVSDKMDKSWADKKAKWNTAARAALDECVAVSEACNVATTNAAGVLVFPELTSASFIVGGTGGTGVLMVGDEPVGYYNLAAGSLGFQAGVEQVSQIMTFNTADALADLQGDAEWRAGAEANVTAIEEGANATAIADGDLDSLGEVSTITFSQAGLAAGVSVEGIRLAAVETDEDDMTDNDEWSEDDMNVEMDIEAEMEETGETSY